MAGNEMTQYFLTVAGLALALVGFSGVVANFRPGNTAPWSPQDIAGLRFIYEHAFGACFFALLPFPIQFSGVGGISYMEDQWRLACLFFAK